MAVDIVKPTSDKLSYRFVELHNGIKVVLVSDPETDKSAAALDVRVGSFSDPENISGLAHFTEHMLFYNSEKYPIEDEYNKFVSERGGSTNAFTAAEDTNYHFNVNWEHLADALDRFAQFFICPLISADGVDREIHAVDSEHRKNLNSDAWRGMQLWKHLANPNHPFHKFSTGSLETLQEEPRKQGINVHDAMKRFYEEHYSANLMRLVVYGREDLDSLEELVRSKFSGVKDARRSALDVEPDMFSDSGFLVRVVPERESSILELSWDVPPQCKSYRSLPCNYLSHLLGHEGHGSCFHLLKERKWVSSLLAGEGSLSISSRSIFTVRVELTDEGFDHVLDIATVVFQYINLLRRPEGVAQSIFDEMKALAEMNFNLSDKQNPSTIATGLASALQIFPPEHALLGMYNVPLEFDAAAIRGVLDCLTPQRVRIMWSSKRHAGTVTQSEPIYGTQFQKEPIPQGYLELWEAAKPGEELFLPEPNPFIPSNFDIVEADPLEAPEVIASDDMYKLWYMPDKVFKTPKVYMYTQLVSPVAYGTPEQAVSTRLWVKLLNDYLSALTYPAELAGLYYSLSNSPSGVQLVVHGYNDRLRVLLQKVLQHIEGFEVKRDRFAVCKEQLAREYANMCYDQPYQRAMYNTAMICEARRWHVDEYKAAIAGIEAEDLDRHGTALVAKLFAEVFVMGNITREDAAAHAEDVTAAMRRMGSRPVPACQMPDTRIVELPKGIPLLSSKMGPNPENENSVALITFQVSPHPPSTLLSCWGAPVTPPPPVCPRACLDLAEGF